MTTTADENFINAFCKTRNENALNNVPTPPRTELQPSPYELGFSQKQLNMRRKYEILQYYPNAQSTQTNKLTQKQIYAQGVRGFNSYRRYRPNQLLTPCPVQQVPTTSSDVPGPSMLLYLDSTVPLYNYKTVRDPQAQTSNTNPSPYTLSSND